MLSHVQPRLTYDPILTIHAMHPRKLPVCAEPRRAAARRGEASLENTGVNIFNVSINERGFVHNIQVGLTILSCIGIFVIVIVDIITINISRHRRLMYYQSITWSCMISKLINQETQTRERGPIIRLGSKQLEFSVH